MSDAPQCVPHVRRVIAHEAETRVGDVKFSTCCKTRGNQFNILNSIRCFGWKYWIGSIVQAGRPCCEIMKVNESEFV